MPAAASSVAAAGGSLREEIRSAMSGVGVTLTPEVLSKCAALASSLRVSPSRMAESWEAHSLNRGVSNLNAETFEPFRAALRRDADSASSTVTEGLVRLNAALGKRRAGDHADDGANIVTPVRTPSSDGKGAAGKDGLSAVDAVAVSPTSSPDAKKAKSSTARPLIPVGPKYDRRTGVGKVVASYNPPRDLPDISSASDKAAGASIGAERRRCVVTLPPDFPNVGKPYRHMFSPPEERADVLDDQLVEMGEVLIETHGIPRAPPTEGEEEGAQDYGEGKIAPLEAVGVPRQAKVCCVGRVCNEAHSGRINRTSLLLEGSRHASNGARVKLNVDPLTSGGASYSLFPGQIVAVEGVNSSGFKLVAERICEGAAPPVSSTPPAKLLEYHHGTTTNGGGQGGRPLKLVAACGPYTTADNLDYAPLNDLLATVRAEEPDVSFLLGPFVDMRQPLVASGDVSLGLEGDDDDDDGAGGRRMNVTYETLFAEKVARTLEELYEGVMEEEGRELRTQFVLVPSLDDANAEFVYSQPPFADRLPGGGRELNLPNAEGISYGSLGLQHVETAGLDEGASTKMSDPKRKRVHCVPNPCTLRINELTVGLTSTDILMHMSMDEANANLEPGTRMVRLAQHLLQQRSYYPLFPPPGPGSPAADAGATPPNLDLSRMDGWSMPVRPDLLLVPSRLGPFARTVLGTTLAVNPGTLSRGTTGGTYAVMDVHPMKRETLEGLAGVDDGGMESAHNVQDRARVEVKRI